MKPRTLAITALSASALFVAALIAVMVSIYIEEPRTGPFDVSFTLMDDRGSRVDQSIFKGHPALVYFGYTHCPEACPTALYEVADWLDTLGEQGKALKAYFFSIDPERDTREVMHDYVTAFSPRITGITGNPDEMKKVADGWLVHASKLPSENGDYHMSHTVSLLLIGADGRLKGLIPYGLDRKAALAKIRSLLLKHTKDA
ncbi:SCO family protein (plasmid) [Rhizobium sp. WSM1274]|uniref:SCO family protein n=1 Tax=Rhizobium sp. WSM1274 TaxID=3138254 RepID=UPI0021A3CBFA|nr:SCO family protein [Rhizobium leguminosarum]UWU31794.1 SCO family protein [Rhizobium leguminosarum bv. viciae]